MKNIDKTSATLFARLNRMQIFIIVTINKNKGILIFDYRNRLSNSPKL